MRERERDREREREREKKKDFLGGGGVSQKIFINYEKSVKRVSQLKKLIAF